ncbi:LOW QUALITY PROTEIN: hypothetical protein PHMEG_00034983 [Phytophthora megakarya]|uniref:Uncharacterized protein n=1 Tax=Phytophthora megakarya TaxID=4795 RepID=A0A225UQ05_9STRA|nr:LOW QUALITY PROTEIN: hypothetical protein PHMEG_00034983 [Phytophthora megakarya]
MTTSASHARGFAACEGIHRAILTAAMKNYISDMNETGLPPIHIWSNFRRYSGAPPLNGVSTYQQVARCVKHLRLKHGDRNSVESLKALVREFPRCSGIDAEKAFIFGPTIDNEGYPRIGTGEDDNSLILGVTTISLLEKMKTLQQECMFSLFHINATIELSGIGYPVITCGFSDRSRKYHLTVMFISAYSQ